MTSVLPLRAQVVSEIVVQPDEKWGGLFAGNSPTQPFAEPFSVNTAEMNGNGFYTCHLISSTGRYIHSHEPMRVVFDGKKFTITSDSEKVYAQRGGRTLRQAYLAMHHTQFEGSDKYPSAELFSNIIYETTGFGFTQTAENILEYARKLIESGFPPGIMVLSEGWREIPEFKFDLRYFPDPKGFVEKMHTLGFKVMVTVTPYIPSWGRDYAMLHNQGALVLTSDGNVLTMRDHQGFFAAVDMTLPAQVFSLKESLSELQKQCGVDGFRFECSHLVNELAGRAEFTRNYLAAMQEAGSELSLTEFQPGMAEYQSDYLSSIRTSQPDESGYLLDVLMAGLSAGPFTQILPRLEALDGTEEMEFTRYALAQMMMPVAYVSFEPWKYVTYASEVKRVLTFRASLVKYVEQLYTEACKTIEPMVRPMEYQFAKVGFADCSDQYMLGNKYLIAPAVDESLKRLVRLPKGTWRDMNGKKHKGPVVIEVETDGYKMVWFELQ